VSAVKQEYQNDKQWIVLYAKIQSTWKWYELKREKGTFRYLRQNIIFVCIDQFETEKTGIAGFILEIHGLLVRKEELTEEIKRFSKYIVFNNKLM
jgi:hypothetical protein